MNYPFKKVFTNYLYTNYEVNFGNHDNIDKNEKRNIIVFIVNHVSGDNPFLLIIVPTLVTGPVPSPGISLLRRPVYTALPLTLHTDITTVTKAYGLLR